MKSEGPYPWQMDLWSRLENQLEQRRLPHALMLTGEAEIGKQDFALAFAQRLLCTTPVDGQACDRCKQCELYLAGSHPDFFLVEPEESGKPIKIDHIRPLADFANKTAAQKGWRVILLSPAEAMNVNAANAFLKTLEEPGENVVLLLVTHQPGRVLPTIRSRCRLLAFPTPTVSSSAQWLASKGSEPDVERAITLAVGKPLRAKRLLETDLLQRLDAFSTALGQVESGESTPIAAAKSLDMLSDLELLEAFQCRVYNAIKWLSSRPQPRLDILFRFLDKLNLVKKRLLSPSNLNNQLVWEEVLMDWKSVVDLDPNISAARER